MKKVDSEEFYQSEQFNTFSEYQPFSAENYSMPEAAKPPKEANTYDESFENQGVQSEREGKQSGKDNAKELQKQYDKLNNSNSSDTGDTSMQSSSSGADGAQTAANSSQAASTSSSGAASSAGATAGAATGATAVAAVIIISGGITGGFISDFNSHIKSDAGMDYVSITVDMDELMSQADSSYNLSADNFSIELTEGGATSKVALIDGKHSYLITGLQPNKTYTYSLICNNPSLGSNSNCYSNSFTTLSLSEPRGVYDEQNNYITYDELTQTATVGYSVYLSDYNGIYDEYTFYICSSEQTDPSSVDSVIYSSQTLDGDNFFRGEVGGITCNELYLYVVGERVGEYGAEAEELFSLQLIVDLPEEWQTDNNPAFEVDESAEDIICRPDGIYISGALTDINQNYTYFAYVTQYDKDGTALVERQEVGLITDPATMSYTIESVAYYGVNAYEYVIYTLDNLGNEVVVYSSSAKAFTASQAFGATYNKVEPADVTITYTAEKITITAAPKFSSAYNNYSYKLVVTNSAGVTFGEYQGSGVATIEITDFATLDEINFTYYDIGEFAGSEVELGSYTTTGMAFNHIFMVVDESAEEVAEQPDSITVNGKLNKLNENFTYYAYVNQYNADGDPLTEREEVALNIDPSTMSYTIESVAYYGVNAYEYVIYTLDNLGNEVVVYNSGAKAYTASQAFGATYNKVEPADAAITYTAEKITITADPGFSSAYNNYSYKLVVTNSAGVTFGEYKGSGVATIEIADFAALDEINFTYYDIGEFAGNEVALGSHTTTGMAFNHIFMAVDESAEEIAEQPDSITVNGKLNKLNENFTYYAYVNQYNADGDPLTEREEVALNIDPAAMSYTIESVAYYGVNNFKYVIYTLDNLGNEVVVYSSSAKAFSASQAFGATYNKVEPADATIAYTAEKITITVDAQFTSVYGNYSYKLVVTNSLGVVFGEYQGSGVAVIEITDFATLDEINFTYYDIGEFAGNEVALGSHTTTGMAFNHIFMVVDESAEEVAEQPDGITVNGKLNKLNENFTYYAYVNQYNADGDPLTEREEVALNIDPSTMSYTIESVAYYGVNAYEYVIYTLDNLGNEVVVYSSSAKAYTASQAFGATYNKVEPADATITYTAEKITITADPEFSSAYNNYSYKLVVTNSAGVVFGEYQGSGVATIEIADFATLDEINFIYYDIGEFAGNEVALGRHTTTGMAFNHIFMAVDESAEEVAEQPDNITVNGKLNKLNQDYTYYAYVNQYNADGDPLTEREEVALNIDPATMSYTIESVAYYGVNNFKYVIYTLDNLGNEVVVYSSGAKAFTASQAFGATYNKVEPADATIAYTAEKITITADPGFSSAYNNYSYKLVVTNSLGVVFGEYQGSGVAAIEIADFATLDEINFTYYDIGEFAGSEIELGNYTTTGMAFNHIFMVVDESAEEVAEQPDSITVNGKLNKLNENFTYYAYVNQYNADGGPLTEREEVALNIDPATMSYTIESVAYYGVNAYEYVIYTLDNLGNEVVVYSSSAKAYTASQAFSATYNKVEPADATINYTAEKITITADPGFSSAYNNYSYKLVVTNSAGVVFGEYQGNGIATIEIADFAALDEINFTYYDIGEFAGSEVELGSYTTTGMAFNHIFMAVDESAEEVAEQPDNITVNGKLNKLNENFTYYAYVNQYNADGDPLTEREEVALNIDPAAMSYTIESVAYYGVNAYEYVICTLDNNGEEITVYESSAKAFTASQAFGATYNKVEPADATITYTAEKITITADPGFSSAYNNYSYKLVVTNSAGVVFGEYQGSGIATIEIADFADLDEINFTYYDLGEFAGSEVELGSYTTTGVAFCMPALMLSPDYGFDGQYFNLSYACDMIYDFAGASMDIEVTTADGATYTKHIDSVSEKGTMTLDNIEGEIGNVTVTATLNFTDNQSDGTVHSLQLAQAGYVLNYSFEVTNVLADVSGYSTDMPVTLGFDYILPNGYQIKITDQENSIDLTIDLTKEYSITGLTMDTEYNLTIQATDAGGNNWGEAKAVNISKSAAEAEYTSPTMSSPNPGDAVVTYNDDGTINVYREMIPSAYGVDTISTDERVYYNAYMYSGYYDNDGNFVKTYSFDVIGRGKYAVIENIPKANYNLTYYKMFDYNGVSYIMYTEIPSGTVETVYKDENGDGYEDFATAAANVSGGQTVIEINVSYYGKVENKIILNGAEYQYDSYSGEDQTSLTLTLEGEVEVTEVTIFFTSQGGNYEAYSDLTMKGSKYGGHTIAVTPVEA